MIIAGFIVFGIWVVIGLGAWAISEAVDRWLI
jgi:hypothetical protein